MPGLLRGVARTAVVAGTATAVSNRVSRRQAGRWARQETAYASPPPEAQQGYAVAPPPSGTDVNTKLAQLRELGQLRDSGVLDDAEFELQKSQILNS
jgi:Short C-terminal domain